MDTSCRDKSILEEKTMYDPNDILTWLDEHVNDMRRSRKKTLACIVSGAMRMQGTGVLALGRAMDGPTAAKHRIKRVDRFLANDGVEVDAVSEAIFHQFRPRDGQVVVLADWTDRYDFQTLSLALPRDGRAIPFYSINVEKGDGSGAHAGLMVTAEEEALEALARMCGSDIRPIIIADRGFGNTRWLEGIQKRGWSFVQRIARNHYVEVEHYIGQVHEVGTRRGWGPRDHGKGTMGQKQWGPIRLISVFDREAKEPWYLVTNLMDEKPSEIVARYTRRMWIEAMFRDLKNRDWGLGMDKAKLTILERLDRHFLILALAYVFLVAFGAAAESAGLGEELKANTVEKRVLSLARIGNYFIQTAQLAIPIAINALLDLPT
jgi:hypothetical protein